LAHHHRHHLYKVSSLIFLALLTISPVGAPADVLQTKSGSKFKGIITKEDKDSVEIDVGGGTVVFHRAQIAKIERSDAAESEKLRDDMSARQEAISARKEEFSESRRRRLEEYEKWNKDALAKKVKDAAEPTEVNLVKSEDVGDAMVEVLINDKVKATLILDTGSPSIVLTRKIGEKLGLDLSEDKNRMRRILLTGKERLTKTVLLKSIAIEGVRGDDLVADVLLDDSSTLGLKDGLLGLAFLNRFDSTIDLGRMKMRLQKRK